MDREFTDDELLRMIDGKDDAVGADHLEVEGASGAKFMVMGQGEKEWFQSNLDSYKTAYRFEDIADLQDLDRLLGLELLSYRYTSWLVRGMDYGGQSFLEKDIRMAKDRIDQEIRQLKGHMGMDRKHRMVAETESVAEYLRTLKARAHEFGVHRDNQIAKAIDLFNELKKMVGLYRRCDEEERRSLGVEMDQIFKWIEETAIPEYDSIDDAFRKNQKLWIREVA